MGHPREVIGTQFSNTARHRTGDNKFASRVIPNANISKANTIRMGTNETFSKKQLAPLIHGLDLVPTNGRPFDPLTIKLDIPFVVHEG